MMTKKQIEDELNELKERLKLYIEKERDILTGGVQSYGIGNRNLARYNADLTTCRDTIKALKKEIAELEALEQGQRQRKAVRIVPQDW